MKYLAIVALVLTMTLGVFQAIVVHRYREAQTQMHDIEDFQGVTRFYPIDFRVSSALDARKTQVKTKMENVQPAVNVVLGVRIVLTIVLPIACFSVARPKVRLNPAFKTCLFMACAQVIAYWFPSMPR